MNPEDRRRRTDALFAKVAGEPNEYELLRGVHIACSGQETGDWLLITDVFDFDAIYARLMEILPERLEKAKKEALRWKT